MIRENLSRTSLTDAAELSCADYSEALSAYQKRGLKFSLVLIDPPYRKGFDRESLELICRLGLASPNCTAVCEHDAQDRLPEQIGCFTKRKEKKYGTVAVSVYGNEV